LKAAVLIIVLTARSQGKDPFLSIMSGFGKNRIEKPDNNPVSRKLRTTIRKPAERKF